jgi:integrase
MPASAPCGSSPPGCPSEWRYLSPFNQQSDWVFASPEMKGQQPYWPENLLRRRIRPAALRCGIHRTIGWHTFRHSYATQLKANGEDVKVVQESLRHANSRITLDTYTQALTPAKRQAQTRVVKMICRSGFKLLRREEGIDSAYCSFLFPRRGAKLSASA